MIAVKKSFNFNFFSYPTLIIMINNKPEFQVSPEKSIIKKGNKQARRRYQQKVGKDKIKKHYGDNKEKLQKLLKNWYIKLSRQKKLKKGNMKKIDIGTYLKKTHKK